MKETTDAEDRLLETVLIFMPDYQPGWSEDSSLAAQDRTRTDFERFRRVYILPLGLVALGLWASSAMDAAGIFKADFPVAPLMFAAITARSLGLRAARVTAALTVPILVYAMHSNWDADLDDLIWATVHFGGLAAVSIDASSWRSILRRRRSPNPTQHSLDQRKGRSIITHRLPRRFALS